METEVTPISFDSRTPIERRSLRPFKSSEEYLYAMKEDLAEWLHLLYDLDIDVETFLDRLETGVVLCQHANNVSVYAERCYTTPNPLASGDNTNNNNSSCSPMAASGQCQLGSCRLTYHQSALAGTFYARANVHSFVRWCRQRLFVPECLLFETEDLVSRKNERHVVLCLLEVARRGAAVGLPVPVLVQFEQQIERQLAAEREHQGQEEQEEHEEQEEEMSSMVYGPWQQVVTNDLKSLDQMVRELVERCVCPSQFPMVRISEGKYRIGDTKTFIFVRVLRNHVMVRVGGGWDTLGHYLDKHDPCRCGTGQRGGSSFKLSTKTSPNSEAVLSSVSYDRSDITGANTPPPRRGELFRQSSRRKQEEGSGDSSSEVSDEGYRSQGYSRLSSSTLKEDRPESRLTQSSDSSEPSTKTPQNTSFSGIAETTPRSNFQPKERSPTKTIPINTPTTKMISARNVNNDENGDSRTLNKTTSLKTPLQKRNSCEANRQDQTYSKSTGETTKMSSSRLITNRADKNRTWATSSTRRTRQRCQIKPDTFSEAGGVGTSMETLTMSPLSYRRRPHAQSTTPTTTTTSPPILRRTGSALLDRLLDDPEALNDDSRMLQRMHELVSQYRPMLSDLDRVENSAAAAAVAARGVNPRKDSVRSRSVGPSRIPAPVRTE